MTRFAKQPGYRLVGRSAAAAVVAVHALVERDGVIIVPVVRPSATLRPGLPMSRRRRAIEAGTHTHQSAQPGWRWLKRADLRSFYADGFDRGSKLTPPGSTVCAMNTALLHARRMSLALLVAAVVENGNVSIDSSGASPNSAGLVRLVRDLIRKSVGHPARVVVESRRTRAATCSRPVDGLRS
jgi:hypothetical protein